MLSHPLLCPLLSYLHSIFKLSPSFLAGDVVCVELLPEDEWRGASCKLPSGPKGAAANDAAGEGEEEEEDEQAVEEGVQVFQVRKLCTGLAMLPCVGIKIVLLQHSPDTACCDGNVLVLIGSLVSCPTYLHWLSLASL